MAMHSQRILLMSNRSSRIWRSVIFCVFHTWVKKMIFGSRLGLGLPSKRLYQLTD